MAGESSGRGIEWQRLQVAWVTSGSGVSVMGNECQDTLDTLRYFWVLLDTLRYFWVLLDTLRYFCEL